MISKIKWGEIYLAELAATKGSEQNGVRPVLVIQNNKGNKYSPTTIVACLSSKVDDKAKLPTHYILPDGLGLKARSMVLCEQIRVIDKRRLLKKIGVVPYIHMAHISQKIRVSLNLKSYQRKKIK